MNYLELVAKEPFANEMEKKMGRSAKRIIPLRKLGTWSICTVLFANVSC